MVGNQKVGWTKKKSHCPGARPNADGEIVPCAGSTKGVSLHRMHRCVEFEGRAFSLRTSLPTRDGGPIDLAWFQAMDQTKRRFSKHTSTENCPLAPRRHCENVIPTNRGKKTDETRREVSFRNSVLVDASGKMATRAPHRASSRAATIPPRLRSSISG